MIVENCQLILYRRPFCVYIWVSLGLLYVQGVDLSLYPTRLISLYLDFTVFPFSLDGGLALLAAPQIYILKSMYIMTHSLSNIKPVIFKNHPRINSLLFFSTQQHWHDMQLWFRIWRQDFIFSSLMFWLDLEPARPSQLVASKAILSRAMVTVSPSLSLSPPSPATISFHSQHYSTNRSSVCLLCLFLLNALCLSHPVENRCICLSSGEFITLKCLHSPRGPPAY